jgi:hypothetical protein
VHRPADRTVHRDHARYLGQPGRVVRELGGPLPGAHPGHQDVGVSGGHRAEVVPQRLLDDVRLGGLGQDPVVRQADVQVQELVPHEQQDPDAGERELHRIAHHQQCPPAPAVDVAGRAGPHGPHPPEAPDERLGDVHLVEQAAHHHQRGRQRHHRAQRGEQHHRDAGVGERAQEVQREDQHRRDRDRDGE